MKKLILSISIIALMIFLVGCSTNNTTVEEEVRVFTIDELSEFNGKDGNPAYVSIDGLVYDLTDIGAWENGEHNGMKAGNELSEEIKNLSPHGVSVLKDLPVVGRLAE